MITIILTSNNSLSDYTTSIPSIALSVVRDVNETARKKWSREILGARGFHAAIFSPQFSFKSRATDQAKEGLLVVYFLTCETVLPLNSSESAECIAMFTGKIPDATHLFVTSNFIRS